MSVATGERAMCVGGSWACPFPSNRRARGTRTSGSGVWRAPCRYVCQTRPPCHATAGQRGWESPGWITCLNQKLSPSRAFPPQLKILCYSPRHMWLVWLLPQFSRQWVNLVFLWFGGHLGCWYQHLALHYLLSNGPGGHTWIFCQGVLQPDQFSLKFGFLHLSIKQSELWTLLLN